ncbi:MAG: sulfur carrier protein ThiS [Porcipelethomonas sp.]
MIKVNGAEAEVSDILLSDYISSTSYDPKRIAVEVNGDIVPKSRYSEFMLRDGDVVEIVGFVGGG